MTLPPESAVRRQRFCVCQNPTANETKTLIDTSTNLKYNRSIRMVMDRKSLLNLGWRNARSESA